eukprot:SAG31_NODE_2454_length_5664_cov_4.255885_4_plen_145_part_00
MRVSTASVALGWSVLRAGSLPSVEAAAVVAAGTAGVALVLYLWSELTASRGTHGGVHRLVDDQKRKNSRTDALMTHGALLLFAFGNALCEEMVSRGLFLNSLAAQYGRPAPGDDLGWLAVVWLHIAWWPNLCQAIRCVHFEMAA